MTQFMASVATDARALLADIPKIFSAPNPTAPFNRFASDFPDLAKEVTSMMHAQSFQAGLGRLQTVDPAIYTAITSPQSMAALVGALGQHSVASMPLISPDRLVDQPTSNAGEAMHLNRSATSSV